MKLAVTMIVKNESDVLDRALGAVSLFADEIVVVDTGSFDGTADIARRYTDGVYSFEWCDDFSAARNYAISKVTADYWMWLDADDIVPPKTVRAIKRFMRAADGSADVVMMPYGDGGAFGYLRERILKTDGRFAFSGRVHEAVAPRGNVLVLSAPIVHAKPSGRITGERNLDIYRAALGSGQALSPRDMYYYARELYFHGKPEAGEWFRKFLAAPDGTVANKCDACLILSRIYSTAGELDRAFELASRSLSYAVTGEGCCAMGLLCLNSGRIADGITWFKLALRLKPDYLSGAFIDKDCYAFFPLMYLTVCYDRLGDRSTAYKYHLRAKKLRPNDGGVLHNEAYFSSLLRSGAASTDEQLNKRRQ